MPIRIALIMLILAALTPVRLFANPVPDDDTYDDDTVDDDSADDDADDDTADDDADDDNAQPMDIIALAQEGINVRVTISSLSTDAMFSLDRKDIEKVMNLIDDQTVGDFATTPTDDGVSFDYVDECVASGNSTYVLTIYILENGTYTLWGNAEKSISVTGTEDECGSLEPDAGDDNDDDDDNDDGCGGCAVNGGRTTGLPLFAFMLAVGVCAAWIRRQS